MKLFSRILFSGALFGLLALPAHASTLTNWARAGVATQSSTYNGTAVASRAIDGNTAGAWGDNSTTHTVTGDPGEWWQVDLQEAKPIGHIHLWFREDCCFDRNENLRIVVYDKADVATRVVLWETNNLAWGLAVPRDIGFDVEPAINGQVVLVEHLELLPGFVCLTEVEVLDQALAPKANYALLEQGGSASSSSCYLGDCTLYGPMQAIDGSHHGLTSVSPWAYSAPDDTAGVDPLPWWQVDLAAPQTVGSVVIWPRRDRTLTRFQNIRLTVADAGANVLYQQLFATLPGGPKYVVNLVPPVANAQSVKIEATEDTPDKFLNLPEVEVFAPLASAPAITFTTDLLPVTVEQNRPATFGPVVVTVDGGIRPEDISYRWYRNGVAIPNMAGSWLGSYTTANLAALADSGDKFKVEASVSGHGVLSTEVELTVTNDITAPVLASHNVAVTDLVRMNLVFSEMLDPVSARLAVNYVLAGGPTLGPVTLGADQQTVTLEIQNILLGDVIDLTVSGVKDLAGNTMTPAHIVAESPQEPINYARAGTARQDSNYGASVASRAIDGNTAGTWGAASIACTSGNEPGWWEVDLQATRTIGFVKIFWRTDCCPRNANIDLVVYDTADEATRVELSRQSISDETGLGSAPFTLELGATPLTGQVVRLEHRSDTPPNGPSWNDGGLQMCLAEVMLLPPPTGLQITTSPRNWSVYEGDRVLLKGAVMGASPITYQWQKDGVDVPGATAVDLTIEKITAAQAGVYTLVAQNAVRVRSSTPASVVVSPRPSLANSLIARYLFEEDTGATVVDSSPINASKTVMHDGINTGALWVGSVEGRSGVMQFDGTTSPYSVIEAVSHPDFDGPNTNQPITLTLWMKAPDCNDLPGNSGSMLFDRLSGAQGYGAISYQAADALGNVLLHSLTGGYATGTHPLGDDTWHHVALVYVHVPYSIGLTYVDGVLDSDAVYDLAGSWPTFRNLMIGGSWDGWWKHFNGYMDDVHIFNRVLDATEVAEVKAGLSLPPALSYTRQGNQLTITWTASGYILQQNSSLSSPAGWVDIPGATTGTTTITIPATGQNFYRLKK